MVSEDQKLTKKSKNGIPDELVDYLDFAIRLRRSYEILQKIDKKQCWSKDSWQRLFAWVMCAGIIFVPTFFSPNSNPKKGF